MRIDAEQSGINGVAPSVAKFIDQNYLYEALKELNPNPTKLAQREH